MNVRNKAAIVGIGSTPYVRDSGATTMTLAIRAITAALDDAGLDVRDVDGVASFSLVDSTMPTLLPSVLGLPDIRYYLHQLGGGSASHTVISEAAMACALGVADVVVCYRALNERSGVRFGQVRPAIPDPEAQFLVPHGAVVPVQQFAMVAREHMIRYGTTAEQLGTIAIVQREYASRNERAMMREPLTMDQYLASPMIAEPLRRHDCCLETDGACAIVVTSAERARDLRHRPVRIRAAGWGPGRTRFSTNNADLTAAGPTMLAPRLFAAADLTVGDVDVAMLYDAFTISVPIQLEGYGFCEPGEGGSFVASGATAPGGAVPTNTHGGLLSEGYVHGLNHVYEAVSQLRGDAGSRQVSGARIALSAAEAGLLSGHTSALILDGSER